MSTPTTNMALLKAVDGDNSKTYLETSLGGSLDTIDAHDHSTTAKGLPVQRLTLSQANGDLFYGTSASAISRLAIGGSGTFLTSNGSVPAWSNTITTGGLTVGAGASSFTTTGGTTT